MSVQKSDTSTNGNAKSVSKTKRKLAQDHDEASLDSEEKEEEEEDDDDESMINVDFEWFDPQESDFHGLKILLRQLFDSDNDLFDLSALSDLILSQPLLGSTVKVPEDGMQTNETDPFAILTVLNLHERYENLVVKQLVAYLQGRCKASTGTSLQQISDILASSSGARVGLLLSERFVNMPPQIVPPMYNMLLEEVRWAVEEREPYNFTHYLLLSKTYTETASQLGGTVITEESPSGPQKKKAKSEKRSVSSTGETFYFHAEDEVFARFALASGNFPYVHGGVDGASDAKRAFQEAGIEPVGHLVLIEGARFEEAVRAVEEYINAG